ncbi:MAG: hypothetical protein LRZ87_03835 [Methanocellales archaeon]|nr:hypothetical protein [Methanocellales archaeon]
MEGVPFDKFIWSREDKEIVDDVPALKWGNIVFRYTPPIYNISMIYLRGYIRFKCLFGVFNLWINESDDEKDKAIRKIKEYYKDFF